MLYYIYNIEVYTHANIHFIVCLAVSTFTNHEFPGFTAGSLSATAERRAHGVRFWYLGSFPLEFGLGGAKVFQTSLQEAGRLVKQKDETANNYL